MRNNIFTCPECGQKMTKVMFVEKEEMFDEGTHSYRKTGRARWQCNNLTCEYCGHQELVDDDTFAEEWFDL